jgi:hypothetical protein
MMIGIVAISKVVFHPKRTYSGLYSSSYSASPSKAANNLPVASEKPATAIATCPRYFRGTVSSVIVNDAGANAPFPRPTRKRIVERYQKSIAQ